MSMNAIAVPWHPPMIFQFEDIERTPKAAQLVISPGKFKWTNRNEHEAEMNQARVDAWRDRQVDILPDNKKKSHPRSRCTVTYDGDILDMLVAMRQILDHETQDAKVVGDAISQMLADTAAEWKEEREKKF